MTSSKLELRTLRLEDEASFRQAVAAFSAEIPPWRFAFDFDRPIAFADYLEGLERRSRGIDVPAEFVASTYYVGVVEGGVVGRLSLRHSLNASLARIGGHIGYGVIPAARGKGYAVEMVRQVLPHCVLRGIDPALITCDEDNLASRRVVEKCGGVYEGSVDCAESGVPKRRYWLATTRPSAKLASAP